LGGDEGEETERDVVVCFAQPFVGFDGEGGDRSAKQAGLRRRVCERKKINLKGRMHGRI
jgi:hypothetical protein